MLLQLVSLLLTAVQQPDQRINVTTRYCALQSNFGETPGKYQVNYCCKAFDP